MSKKADLDDIIKKARVVLPKDFEGDKLLWDMIRDIRLLKYIRRSQLKDVNHLYSKICAKEKINTLIELKLIRYSLEDIIVSSAASLRVLRKLNYPTDLYPKGGEGKGDINELHNTEVFIQALKLTDYKALLYPNFGYIEPDALLVRGTKEKYYLEFLEVEVSKSNWPTYLEQKRINYLRLAGDIKAYNYWKEKCELLNLTAPDIKDFRFSVSVIGKVKKDFGTGFNFMEEL